MRMRKKIQFLIAFFIFCLSLFHLAHTWMKYKRADREYQVLSEEVKRVEQAPELMDDRLKEVNSDYIGWIRIPGTAIDYPVVMESKKDYLKTGFYGNESIAGTPFIRRAQDAFVDPNTVIFAHNMKNGSMFGSLKNYLEKKYCEENPVIEVQKDGKTFRYRIFSVQLISEKDAEPYTYSFRDEAERGEYLDNMIRRSIVDFPEAPKAPTKILTLSTCHGSDKRLLVQAFKENVNDEQ